MKKGNSHFELVSFDDIIFLTYDWPYLKHSLAYVQRKDLDVVTPTGSVYSGFEIIDETNIVAVSIIRAGDSMLESFMHVCQGAQVGKILIQRNEETAEPMLFYSKLPSLAGKYVVLLDPMLGKW